MFGYVTFYKDELKIKDYNKFRAYYCGLCKELGKRFNQLVRFGLSYDFTFLALLMDSQDDADTVFAAEGCLRHMGRKRATVKDNQAVSYAADMSVALMYFKLIDDVRDDFSPASAIAMIPYWFAVRRVRRKYPDTVKAIRDNLAKLAVLEKNKCANIDEVAHPFAEIMRVLFSVGGDANGNLGYNIGRFIYIADAANDYEKDVKKDKYNPYRYAYHGVRAEEIKEIAGRSMMLTLAMTGESYSSLNICKNKELLDNIIYMGLRHRMDAIVCPQKCDKEGRTDGESL